jgi:hypothetical protein
MDVYIDIFLTSPLLGGQWSTSLSGRLALSLGTHFIGGWFHPGGGLKEVKRENC